MRKFRSVRTLERREIAWLAALYALSGLARAAVLWAPFRFIAAYLGTPQGNASIPQPVEDPQLRLAMRIGDLGDRAARNTPWQSNCLVRAIMVKTLLKHYRIPHVLGLGVAKEGADRPAPRGGGRKGLIAHAWVQVGSRVVTGGKEREAYTTVAAFVNGP